MAGTGPAPKERRARDRDNANRDAIVADGQVRGFDLPDLPGGEAWHPITEQVWESWRRSPQAVRMVTDLDWYFLLDTMLMHHTMWSKGKWEFAAEVRLRAAKFGVTPEDRLRLKLEVEVPETFAIGDSGNANVTRIDSHRQRWADK